MTAKNIEQQHEYAALILERLVDQERAIASHESNVRLYNSIGSTVNATVEEKKITRRRAAMEKLWNLYNAALNEIQLNMFNNLQKTA